MRLTELAVRRPVFTMIIYVAVTLFGMYALHKLPLDLYPEIENPVISVVITYPGASSWDVEEKITKPMEKGLGILTGLKEIRSKSLEGVSVIFLRFTFDTNLDEAANDVRSAIDWVTKALPDGLDRPILFKFNTAYMPIYFGALISDLTDTTKERIYLDDHVVQALQAVPGVGAVQLFHVAAEEVHVDLKLAELEKRGLAPSQINQAIAVANVAMPAGKVDDGTYELPVRVPAEFRTVDEIADLVVGFYEGRPVHLRDVAEVSLAHHELPNIATLNGRSIAVFMVQKQSGANTVEIARAVRERIAEIEPELAKGIKFVKIFDASDFIVTMVSNLYQSLLIGGLLVVLVVITFLRRFRASLIVALSIPGSMIIVFLLMHLKQYTLNAISLMGMTLAIGMVVDNSIVVLENINRHLDAGRHPRESSILGAAEVGLAVSASTFTTIGVFLPMIFVTGLVSVLFGQLAFIVVVTLLASLVTSLFLTPMLTARMLRQEQARRRLKTLETIERAYSRLVSYALAHRKRVYLAAISVFALSLLSLTTVGFDFLPQFDTGEVRITLELPPGTSIEESAKVAERLSRKLEAIPDVQNVFYQAGEDEQAWGVLMGQQQGSHIIQFSLMLKGLDTGRRPVEEVTEDVRAIVATINGLVSSDVTYGEQGIGAFMGLKPLQVEVLGWDYNRMKEAAREVEAILKAIPGTRDVAAEVPYEKPEVQVKLDRRRMALLGSSAYQASEAVRTAMLGTTVTRFRGTGKDIDVVVRLRKEDRKDLEQVGRLPVATFTGRAAPLRNFSTVESGFSPISIDHTAQQRVLRVGANLHNASLGSVSAEFDARARELRARYPDLTFRWGGQAKEQRETGKDLAIMLLLGVILTYLIMAGQFESFADPFAIIFSVPFAFSGSFLALALSRSNFSALAFLGLVMLVGIVVNNAIVLVDYVNLMRSQGFRLIEAVVETARRRLRPILMTTITTLFGIAPLAFASGEGSELWKPIGITMLGGLSLSTLVTLVIVPCLYVTIEKIRRKKRFSEAS